MIWIGLTAAALLAFARQLWLLKEYQQYRGRRGLSGCEIARQLLDQVGFPQMSVKSVTGWERLRMKTNEQLLLEAPVYQGQSLLAIAETGKQAVLLGKASSSVIPMDWLIRFRIILRVLILPAWLMILIGAVMPDRFSCLKAAGLFILQTVLVLGIFELSRDWEASQEAYEHLKKTDNFEPDELVKLKHLLSALKWSGLAEIFKVPYDLATRLLRK